MLETLTTSIRSDYGVFVVQPRTSRNLDLYCDKLSDVRFS